MLWLLPLLVPPFATPWVAARQSTDTDERTHYDVTAYRLDLRIDPGARRISGTAGIELEALEELPRVRLDLDDGCRVRRVTASTEPLDGTRPFAGEALEFEHERDALVCRLVRPAAPGERLTIAVSYSAHPTSRDRFTGFHWRTTDGGQPWIDTSCQSIGAHSWWPCKASFFHPEDKPERVFVNATVPAGLTAVSNGRLTHRELGPDGYETFRWRHDYPLPTYSVAINVAPFRVLEQRLALEGIPGEVPFTAYVLAGFEDAARHSFAAVPELLEIFSETFGPYPFPESKVGIVHSSFLGMEHSTAIAYGSSFPDWLSAQGEEDPLGKINRYFDYILVHEFAHEWWGNAVTARDWGDFWLHEGFATYAEAVYLEATEGRERADEYFDSIEPFVGKRSRLVCGRGLDASRAYSVALYHKGAWVLNTLRHYLDDDETWWRTLREFQSRYRYGNAGTRDFQAVLEELSGSDWECFFEQWVYGEGAPRLEGSVRVHEAGLSIEVENRGSAGTAFHVPLDLRWTARGRPAGTRVRLEPGPNSIEVSTDGRPSEVEVVGLRRVLGPHRVEVLE